MYIFHVPEAISTNEIPSTTSDIRSHFFPKLLLHAGKNHDERKVRMAREILLQLASTDNPKSIKFGTRCFLRSKIRRPRDRAAKT